MAEAAGASSKKSKAASASKAASSPSAEASTSSAEEPAKEELCTFCADSEFSKGYFCDAYFIKHIDQLVALRKFIEARPDALDAFEPCDRKFRRIRLEVLKLDGPQFTIEEDMSLGSYIDKIRNAKQIYYVMKPLLALAYIHLTNKRDKFRIRPEEWMQHRDRYRQLLVGLYQNDSDKPDDALFDRCVGKLMEWIDIPSEERAKALRYINRELKSSRDTHIREMAKILKLYCENLRPVAPEMRKHLREGWVCTCGVPKPKPIPGAAKKGRSGTKKSPPGGTSRKKCGYAFVHIVRPNK